MTLNNRKFAAVSNNNGVSSNETIFHYKQSDQLITATYAGGSILSGSVIGKQIEDNRIELLFQCLTDTGELKSGKSEGRIFIHENGKMGLKFDWFWFDGEHTGGQSEYIEV